VLAAESTMKTEELEMILGKTRAFRESVEKLTAYFATRLRLEPGYKCGGCETIHFGGWTFMCGKLSSRLTTRTCAISKSM
jgi:hypothetical protein